jgi:hypothetical protein
MIPIGRGRGLGRRRRVAIHANETATRLGIRHPAGAAHADLAWLAVAAIMDFKGRLAAVQQESPVPPVESTIAVRRLEEDFCLRFVRYVLGDPNSFQFRASFESCLHEEAMEKFEGEDRKE